MRPIRLGEGQLALVDELETQLSRSGLDLLTRGETDGLDFAVGLGWISQLERDLAAHAAVLGTEQLDAHFLASERLIGESATHLLTIPARSGVLGVIVERLALVPLRAVLALDGLGHAHSLGEGLERADGEVSTLERLAVVILGVDDLADFSRDHERVAVGVEYFDLTIHNFIELGVYLQDAGGSRTAKRWWFRFLQITPSPYEYGLGEPLIH